ncbi:hypothetical protein ABZ835_15710 [Streptomyces sp. NPDC047461]|uniref:hypothetical protein n=1 Tax=Streptomyces sp. NPDC047461 TaxID=3155619 RepID=UPI0033D50D85
MTENHNEPIDEGGEVEAAVPEPAVPAKKPVRRGRLAAIAGSVLLTGAVVAGVGYTVVTVDGAERDAGAPVWKFPKDKADQENVVTAKGLAGALVPYTDGWQRGPDLAEFGSDVELGAARATALRKESLRGLPRTERRELEKLIDKQSIEGTAMRSYVKEAGSAFFTDTPVSVSIVLSRMKSQSVVRNVSTSQNQFLDSLDIFRKGPRIKGYKDAACFLPPKDTDEDLDSMYCSAYRGDVLITLTADGDKPFDTKGVAELLKDQLDRIAEPGEAV